jgi:hypothetical protein
MLVAIALALLIVLLSLLAGRLVLHALGARQPTWIAGAVGFAALTIVAPLAIRLPGRAVTAALVIGAALVAGLVATRHTMRPWRNGHWVGLVVIAVTILAAAFPFALGGHSGVLGEGIYTNDQAAQLYWTDWLQNGFGPEPSAVAFGYPVGPQSLVGAVADATGASLVDAFNGLLLAIPALTGLAALAALDRLRPALQVVVAGLVALPFLGASFLAQSAFKETAMALLVVAFAVTLGLASRRGSLGLGEGPPVLRRRAAVGTGVVIAVAGVLAYSVPALVWFALTLGGWLAILYIDGELQVDPAAIRAAASRHRVALIAGLVLLIAIGALSAGRIADFTERIGDVSASVGRLSSPVFPGEAFGIWPEGDFRLVRGEVSGSLLATAFGVVVLIAGGLVLVRRRAYAVLAALAAAGVIYVGARLFSSIYVEAKALAILAPLVVLVGLGGLLSASGRVRRPLLALGALAAVALAASTFLALREAPVGFEDRGHELEQLAAEADGESLVFLGVDRFGGYWLRGTLVRAPGGFVPPKVRARSEKVWQQGTATDLDTLAPRGLNRFDYAVTTTADFQSTPPPGLEEVARTDSYVLWRRTGTVPPNLVLGTGETAFGQPEDGAAGATLDCETRKGGVIASRAGSATVLRDPVVGEPGEWSQPSPLDAPASASQKLTLEPGQYRLSLQYHSQEPLTVRVDDEEVATLPASLVGMYLEDFEAAHTQDSFWPAGELDTEEGGSHTVAVSVAAPEGLADILGAPRKAWLGQLVATRVDEAQEVPLRAACGRYVDRYTIDRESG